MSRHTTTTTKKLTSAFAVSALTVGALATAGLGWAPTAVGDDAEAAGTEVAIGGPNIGLSVRPGRSTNSSIGHTIGILHEHQPPSATGGRPNTSTNKVSASSRSGTDRR